MSVKPELDAILESVLLCWYDQSSPLGWTDSGTTDEDEVTVAMTEFRTVEAVEQKPSIAATNTEHAVNPVRIGNWLHRNMKYLTHQLILVLQTQLGANF